MQCTALSASLIPTLELGIEPLLITQSFLVLAIVVGVGGDYKNTNPVDSRISSSDYSINRENWDKRKEIFPSHALNLQ